MENTPKTAKDWVLKHPGKSNSQIAKLSGIDRRGIDRARTALENSGQLTKDTTGGNTQPSSTFTQNGDKAEYTFISKKRIVSKDDLVEHCDIDLSQWIIEKLVCNKWEVGAKDNNNQIQVTPLFQVKLWLRPFSKEHTEIIEIIEELVAIGNYELKQTPKPQKINSKKALKVTLSDIHIGLDPYMEGKSVFNYIYNEKIFNKNLDKVYQSVINEFSVHGRFDVLFIDDLGDGLDGWNAQTTRGGHSLEQNMDNTEAFRCYVTGKLRFIEMLIQADVANRIELKSVSNCNHSGSFGYIANYSIGLILSRSYDEKYVKNIVLEKFMEHFEYGNHCFILTHGKDAKFQFKGLPLDLNDKAISFINEYIDHYEIRSKYIHVEKGDLHRLGYKRTKKFDYRNFMSFAPPSVWQQHNFGDSYSGYSIQIIPFDNNEIRHTDYFFELEMAKKL